MLMKAIVGSLVVPSKAFPKNKRCLYSVELLLSRIVISACLMDDCAHVVAFLYKVIVVILVGVYQSIQGYPEWVQCLNQHV